MLSNDEAAREARYAPLKKAMNLCGFAAEVLQGRNTADALRVRNPSTCDRWKSCLFARRRDQWFLLAPGGTGTFGIPVGTDFQGMCSELLHRLTAGEPQLVAYRELESRYELVRLSSREWIDFENAYHQAQYEEYGWLRMTDTERDRTWNRVIDISGGFRTPAPPAPYRMWSLAWINSVDSQRRTELESGLTLSCQLAMRECVPFSSIVNALIWQSSGYRFNPHAGIPKVCTDYWAVPIVPETNTCFLAVDESFGIVSMFYRQAVCVFGKSLLDALCTNQPEALCELVGASD